MTEMADEAPFYRRILVPLDGSEEVDRAILRHVARLARHCGSEVILLRVGASHPWDAILRDAEAIEAYLAARKAEFESLGIAARAVMAHGDPAGVILAQAEALDCDLIAMSTHGHGLVRDLLFGSVASKVRHAARVPVLLIRAPGAAE
jgi:nucleotide-binding universal stress UspA family protein